MNYRFEEHVEKSAKNFLGERLCLEFKKQFQGHEKSSLKGSMFSTEGRESYSVEHGVPSQPPSHQWMEDTEVFLMKPRE